jgi:hypothetical protein
MDVPGPIRVRCSLEVVLRQPGLQLVITSGEDACMVAAER